MPEHQPVSILGLGCALLCACMKWWHMYSTHIIAFGTSLVQATVALAAMHTAFFTHNLVKTVHDSCSNHDILTKLSSKKPDGLFWCIPAANLDFVLAGLNQSVPAGVSDQRAAANVSQPGSGSQWGGRRRRVLCHQRHRQGGLH